MGNQSPQIWRRSKFPVGATLSVERSGFSCTSTQYTCKAEISIWLDINGQTFQAASLWAMYFHTMDLQIRNVQGASTQDFGGLPHIATFDVWVLSTLSTLRLRGELWRLLLLSFDRPSQFFQRLLMLSASPTNTGNYNLKIKGEYMSTCNSSCPQNKSQYFSFESNIRILNKLPPF